MDFTNKTELLGYLKQHNLWAKKGLSQNFLIDRTALDKIVQAAELKPDDLVIEIGPGLGTLMQELVQHAGEVAAVEMDKKLAELLNQNFNSKLKIINNDILKVDLNELVGDRSYKVVANIPYHITSKILELFLSRENKPELIVLLVQKEVAERVCAKPGEMSVLAISIQLFGKPEIVDIVKKESFFPSPKVDSAILRIANIKNPFCHSEFISESNIDGIPKQVRDDLALEKSFFRCVHVGFAARRKTLLNNLMVGYGLERKKVVDILKLLKLKETVRAQELSVEEWKRLATVLGSNIQ